MKLTLMLLTGLMLVGSVYGQDTLRLRNKTYLVDTNRTHWMHRLIVDTVGTPISQKIFIEKPRVVWDSLGYVKITTATKIIFRTVSQWKIYFDNDSVWYLRNDERWFVKPLMEIK